MEWFCFGNCEIFYVVMHLVTYLCSSEEIHVSIGKRYRSSFFLIKYTKNGHQKEFIRVFKCSFNRGAWSKMRMHFTHCCVRHSSFVSILFTFISFSIGKWQNKYRRPHQIFQWKFYKMMYVPSTNFITYFNLNFK